MRQPAWLEWDGGVWGGGKGRSFRALMVRSLELFSKFDPQILLSKGCYNMTYILVDNKYIRN